MSSVPTDETSLLSESSPGVFQAILAGGDALLSEELDEGLDKLLTRLTGEIGAEAGSILLVDKASKQLFFIAATGEKAPKLTDLRMSEAEGVAGQCVQGGESLIVNDVKVDPAFESSIDKKSGFRTRNIIACPLKHGGSTFGVLEVINKSKGEFTPADRDVVAVFANMAALAIWRDSRYARCFNALALNLAEAGAGAPMIGGSQKILELKDMVARVAKSDAPILITGESGVGKEVLAKLIWKTSNRKRRAFSAVNCAAIPPTLIESELFGHEKGSFTGAHARHVGRFEAADKGTLFLDEIGELPLDMQVKLLRVLQEMEVTRIGSTKPLKVDVRIVAATNRDLAEAVKTKMFREDLYYRLNVIKCHIPPLRDRREDIEPLARFFVAQFNESMGRAVEEFTPSLLQRLIDHPWPGNIRELRNAIERLMVMCDGAVLDDTFLPTSSGF